MARVETVLKRLSLVGTIIGGGYFAYKLFQELKTAKQQNFTANSYNVKTTEALMYIPSSNPTEPGFSNFARRVDLSKPWDLADQPLGYGEVNPV